MLVSIGRINSSLKLHLADNLPFTVYTMHKHKHDSTNTYDIALK